MKLTLDLTKTEVDTLVDMIPRIEREPGLSWFDGHDLADKIRVALKDAEESN